MFTWVFFIGKPLFLLTILWKSWWCRPFQHYLHWSLFRCFASKTFLLLWVFPFFILLYLKLISLQVSYQLINARIWRSLASIMLLNLLSQEAGKTLKIFQTNLLFFFTSPRQWSSLVMEANVWAFLEWIHPSLSWRVHIVVSTSHNILLHNLICPFMVCFTYLLGSFTS